MLSEDSLRKISNIFCGDEEDLYSYKSGPKLVSFFNEYFGFKDVYQSGFPSRWIYVHNKLVELLNQSRFDQFLNVILSKQFIMKDADVNQVQALEKIKENLDKLNDILSVDLCLIVNNNGKYRICKEDQDLELIGSGGFATVYKQKSTGLVLKKLKEDFATDIGIRSRFKREFNITKSLQDQYGIIRVFIFNEANYSYTMELAECTLEDYLSRHGITDDIRLDCIRQILYIMSEVHKKDIIHRDLSPNNIFILSGKIKIADFGLGKDLKVFTSHQTLHTNSLGQYYYCAPEQFMMLKEGDKRSDVYSIGRLINFIMTGNPVDSTHIFKSVAEKATNNDASYRYADAIQLSTYFEKCVKYHQNAENEKIVLEKIKYDIFDDEVENYIYELPSDKLCLFTIQRISNYKTLIKFMEIDETHANHVIQLVDKSYINICGKEYELYDIFANMSAQIIKNKFPYVVKEIAANILRYVAVVVHRFHAQRLIDDLVKFGIEPMLEDILHS